MHLVSEQLENYIEQFSSKEDEVLNELSRETYLKISMPQMVSGNLQGQFLEMISRLVKPKRILEIGTFTGYSAICMAKGWASLGGTCCNSPTFHCQYASSPTNQAWPLLRARS